MKKRIVTLVVFLLVASMMLTGCTGEGSKTENQTDEVVETVVTEEPTSEGYSYAIGSVTLKLNRRIEDYIDKNNVFHYRDYAKDCGWYIIYPERAEDDDWMSWVYGDEDEGSYIDISIDGDVDTRTINYGGIGTKGVAVMVSIPDNESADIYYINRLFGYHVNYEKIVVICYLFENFLDPEVDVFAGKLDGNGSIYTIPE